MKESDDTTIFILGLKLWVHIGAHRKKQFLTQIALSLLTSTTEIISIGATLPFLALLAEPSKFLENPRVASILAEISFESSGSLIFFFTVFFIAANIVQ